MISRTFDGLGFIPPRCVTQLNRPNIFQCDQMVSRISLVFACIPPQDKSDKWTYRAVCRAIRWFPESLLFLRLSPQDESDKWTYVSDTRLTRWTPGRLLFLRLSLLKKNQTSELLFQFEGILQECRIVSGFWVSPFNKLETREAFAMK